MQRSLDFLAHAPRSPEASAANATLGALPQWDLTDLYASMDAPELKADIARSATECAAFEEEYKGKLAGILDGNDAGGQMAVALQRYESVEDLLGRVYSYAAWSIPATPPTRCGPSSMATCRRP